MDVMDVVDPASFAHSYSYAHPVSSLKWQYSIELRVCGAQYLLPCKAKVAKLCPNLTPLEDWGERSSARDHVYRSTQADTAVRIDSTFPVLSFG